MYKCSNCDYTSNIKCNVNNHILRKVNCGLLENPRKIVYSETGIEVEEKKNNKLEDRVEILKQQQEFREQKWRELMEFRKREFEAKERERKHREELRQQKEEKRRLKEEQKQREKQSSSPVPTPRIKYRNYNAPNIEPMLIKDRFRRCLTSCMSMVPEMITILYNNPKHPENHVVYIKNTKNDVINVYENGWITKSKTEVVKEIINMCEREMHSWAEDNEDTLKLYEVYEQRKKVLDPDQVKSKNKRIRPTTGEEDIVKEVKLLLYNMRPIKNIPSLPSVTPNDSNIDTNDSQTVETIVDGTEETVGNHSE